MKIAFFILGIVLVVAGVCTLGWTWYDAAENGRYSDAAAYAGPVLLILGLLRIVRAAAVVPLPSFARIAVVIVAILVGYGNSAAMKVIFPNASPEDKTTANN